jgi:hypothetical protein
MTGETYVVLSSTGVVRDICSNMGRQDELFSVLGSSCSRQQQKTDLRIRSGSGWTLTWVSIYLSSLLVTLNDSERRRGLFVWAFETIRVELYLRFVLVPQARFCIACFAPALSFAKNNNRASFARISAADAFAFAAPHLSARRQVRATSRHSAPRRGGNRARHRKLSGVSGIVTSAHILSTCGVILGGVGALVNLWRCFGSRRRGDRKRG